MIIAKYRKLFFYLIFIKLFILLFAITFIEFKDVDYLLSFKKVKNKLSKPIISFFNNFKQNPSLNLITIQNISYKNNIKLLKNSILVDLLDLKYDLINEIYILDERNKHLNKLDGLIKQLDRPKTISALYNTDTKLFKDQLICNEYDYGGLSGYPNYEKGVDMNCSQTNQRNLEQKLTIVLNAVEFESLEALQMFLDGLEYKKIKIVVGINEKISISDLNYDENIMLVEFSSSKNAAIIWNYLIVNHVDTEFVLIGKNVERFISKYTKLERLIKILDEIPNMQAVSSSYRVSDSNRWFIGCYQMDWDAKKIILNHYYMQSSSHDSLFCDYLAGPFVTRRNILLENRFDENLENENEVFIDLFIKFNKIGYLMSTIVDSMFFVSKSLSEINSLESGNLSNLAVKWSLHEIQVDNKLNFDSKFLCDDSKQMNISKEFCEDYNRLKVIKNLFNFCENNEISCYLERGNILNENLKLFYFVSFIHNKRLIEAKFNEFLLDRKDGIKIELNYLDNFFDKVFYKYFYNGNWFNMTHSI
jgi:hypothetical protein